MVQVVRIAPIRAANMVGAVYLILFGVFALIGALLTAFLPTAPNAPPEQQQFARTVFRWMLIAYPFLGAATGWSMTLIGASLYNLLAKRIGGFTIETRQVPDA